MGIGAVAVTVDAADLLAAGAADQAIDAATSPQGEPGGGGRTSSTASAPAPAGAQRALLRFVARFLLPLVRGGILHVGRPLGPKFVARLGATLAERGSSTALVLAARAPVGRGVDLETELSVRRHAAAVRLIPGARVPVLDEATLRLGAALHNLLSLTHPAIEGRGADGRQARIADAALDLASLGPPRSAAEAVERHSLLGRLPDIGRSDRVVHFWLGRRSFVGRIPPRRVTALPRLRQVRVDTIHRSWLREIGMPVCARPAFLALNAASPLGETEDLFRLEPPLAWSRILPVLRFPELARLVAGRIVEQGVDRAGDVLADALFRFASGHDPGGSIPGGAAVAFALRFLAHTVWLDLLFSPYSPSSSSSSSSLSSDGPGLDLAVMLVAAQRISSALVWPPDVVPDSDLGRRFIDRMTAMASKVRARGSPRLDAAVGVATLAAQSLT